MSQAVRDLPHGTTIVAATFDHGVVLAGDRRATAGSLIAKRDLEKVYRSDEFSALGYAGAGSLGIELARLFGVELEHYEKMEGRPLSLDGKANRLARMVRGNLGLAMQGLAMVRRTIGKFIPFVGFVRWFPWLIRAWRLIRGSIAHPIDHGAPIHHDNSARLACARDPR